MSPLGLETANNELDFALKEPLRSSAVCLMRMLPAFRTLENPVVQTASSMLHSGGTGIVAPVLSATTGFELRRAPSAKLVRPEPGSRPLPFARRTPPFLFGTQPRRRRPYLSLRHPDARGGGLPGPASGAGRQHPLSQEEATRQGYRDRHRSQYMHAGTSTLLALSSRRQQGDDQRSRPRP